jgi:hypothetical protein
MATPSVTGQSNFYNGYKGSEARSELARPRTAGHPLAEKTHAPLTPSVAVTAATPAKTDKSCLLARADNASSADLGRVETARLQAYTRLKGTHHLQGGTWQKLVNSPISNDPGIDPTHFPK